MPTYTAPGKLFRFPALYGDAPLVICPVDDFLIFGPTNGLESMTVKLASIASAGPAAILTYYGTVLRNVDTFKNQKFILNLSASVSGKTHTNKVLCHSMDLALRMNATAVAFHINILSAHLPSMIEMAGSIISSAHAYDMPVCGIIYPRGEANGDDDNMLHLKETDNIAYADLIARCVSLGVDLGVDLIKTQYSDNQNSFRRAVEAAGNVPLVVAGGPVVPEQIALRRASDAVRAGARGVSFGRNIFGRENPTEFIRMLKRTLGAPAE